MMHLKVFTFNAFQENSFVIWNDEQEAIIVDPGNSNATENKVVRDFLDEKKLKPTAVLLTHAHIDHILGAHYFFDEDALRPHLFHEDNFTFGFAEQSAAMWGIDYSPCPEPFLLKNLNDLHFGSLRLELRLVPGHAKGHVIFINKKENYAIVGDTVFNGSIGRTDLPGGNHQQLLDAVQSEIFTLPEDMTLYPGHGPKTTVGFEKNNNPFF